MRWLSLKLLGLAAVIVSSACSGEPKVDDRRNIIRDAIFLGCLDFTESVKSEEIIKSQILKLQELEELKTNFPGEELGERTCSIFVLVDENKDTLGFILKTLNADGTNFKLRKDKTFENDIVSHQYIWERDTFNIGLTISNNNGQPNHPVSWIASTYRTKERSDD